MSSADFRNRGPTVRLPMSPKVVVKAVLLLDGHVLTAEEQGDVLVELGQNLVPGLLIQGLAHVQSQNLHPERR